MGKRMADRFDDDYFAEPNYDKLSDEELDELYYYGEIRSPAKPKKVAAKKADARKVVQRLFPENEDDEWLDVDLDGDDLYDED